MESVLHKAATTYQTDMMEFLLECCDEELEVDSMDLKERTLIHIVAREEQVRVIKFCVTQWEETLIAWTIRVGPTPLRDVKGEREGH